MELMHFNWLDWLIVGVIALSTLVGLLRGFIREALSLVLWVVAIWVAFRFSDDFTHYLAKHISDENIQYAICFTGLFLAVIIIGGFVNYMVAQLVLKTGLGGTDKIVGFVFGGLRGILVIAIVILLVNVTPISQQPWWVASKMRPHFTWLVDWIYNVLPPKFQEHLMPHPDADRAATPATLRPDVMDSSRGVHKIKINSQDEQEEIDALDDADKPAAEPEPELEQHALADAYDNVAPVFPPVEEEKNGINIDQIQTEQNFYNDTVEEE